MKYIKTYEEHQLYLPFDYKDQRNVFENNKNSKKLIKEFEKELSEDPDISLYIDIENFNL